MVDNSRKVMTMSRLVLGTAQLGMAYGVSNMHGAPAKDQAFAILNAALEGGINTFDTASAYGRAEAILGQWITSSALARHAYVITKIQGDDAAPVREEIEASLSRLQISRLDGCLLHAPQNMYKRGIIKSMQDARKSGVVLNIGVSVYDEADALHAIELDMDYVQISYNAFDQRLDQTDFFARAKAKNVTVFARSPFLQGLLLMDPEHLPPHLVHARSCLRQFIGIAKRHNLSQLEASLGFASLNCRADHIVFGVDSAVQLKEITVALERSSAEHGPWIDEMVSTFQTVDRTIADPRSWKTV